MRLKPGKVGENVLKRSVLQQIKTKREEVLIGAGIGEDCAFFMLEEDEIFVTSMDPITITFSEIGKLSVLLSMNDIAASGATPVGILATILLPPKTTESKLKRIMEQMEEQCKQLQIQLVGGHTESTEAVNQPIITITSIGKIKKDEMMQKPVTHGQDIVLSKWIGLEGTGIIAKEKEEELSEKFPAYFVKEANSFLQYLSIVPEAAVARKSSISCMHDVAEGGIFGALWELAEKAEVGLEIDLKKISIKQETVEICEFYELNPYDLLSGGALLMVTDYGHDLVKELEVEGIHSTVIGKIVEGNDRIIMNGDERRFLEPAKMDEIYKVMAHMDRF
ncbi:MAG: AIR synthase family protein [Eubacteriales bacterium]